MEHTKNKLCTFQDCVDTLIIFSYDGSEEINENWVQPVNRTSSDFKSSSSEENMELRAVSHACSPLFGDTTPSYGFYWSSEILNHSAGTAEPHDKRLRDTTADPSGTSLNLLSATNTTFIYMKSYNKCPSNVLFNCVKVFSFGKVSKWVEGPGWSKWSGMLSLHSLKEIKL